MPYDPFTRGELAVGVRTLDAVDGSRHRRFPIEVWYPLDEVEREHDAVRAMKFPPDLEWITREMRPIAELSSGAQAHTFVRGLALAHFDAALRGHADARRFLSGDVAAALAAHGVEAIAPAA